MRIRTIKPSFFKCEDLADLEPMARLTFVGLWLLADRDGRLEDRPRRIKAELFPYDDMDIEPLLSSLAAGQFIVRYEVGSVSVIQVPNFRKHQRITGKEAGTPSELPAMPGSEDGETTGKQRGNGDRFSTVAGMEWKGKEGKGEEVELPPEWHPLLDPETIVGFIRSITTADPEPGMLHAWKACILDLKSRNADPHAIIAALRNHRNTDPKFRTTLPEARFLKSAWFTKLVEKTIAHTRQLGED